MLSVDNEPNVFLF